MKTCLLSVTIIILCANSIISQNLLRYPESAAYYEPNNSYYVSNQETGTIVIIDENGGEEIFAKGMATTIGLAIRENVIYAIGNNEVYGFSLSNAAKLFYLKVNSASKLNDITFDKEGNIYSSDVLGDKIYKISFHCFGVSIWDEMMPSVVLSLSIKIRS